MAYPLRAIVARPSYLEESLECGHTIRRPLGLGEFAGTPSKVQRRRCYKCPEVIVAPSRPRLRGAPTEPRGDCPKCGKKGLGNTFHAHGRGAYRQCRYCNEVVFNDPR